MKKLFAALGICFLLLLTSSTTYAERSVYSYTDTCTNPDGTREPVDVYVLANAYSGFCDNGYGGVDCLVGVVVEGHGGGDMSFRCIDNVWYCMDFSTNRFLPMSYHNEMVHNVLATILSDEYQQAVREEQALAAEEQQARKIQEEQERERKEQERIQAQKFQRFNEAIQKGNQYLENKDNEKAKIAYYSAIKIVSEDKLPSSHEEIARLKLAGVYREEKQYSKILNLFPRDKDYEHVEVYYFRAEACSGVSTTYKNDKAMFLKYLREAKLDFQTVMDMHPGGVMEDDAKKFLGTIGKLIPD